MWNTKPLAALSSTFGRIKGKASHFYHRKGGPLAAARENVKYVHRQVANFEASCEWHELDERHPTKRYVSGFFAAVRRHEGALTGYSEENVEAMDALERESNHLVAAASTLYAIDPPLFQAKMGVELLSAVRGLNSEAAFERYLADLKLVAEDRRERAAFFKQRREEGYKDRHGMEHSPAKIAAKAEREAARKDDPSGWDARLASRLAKGGKGLQDEEANNESMRTLHASLARNLRKNPDRLRMSIIAAHGADAKAPRGAQLSPKGFVVQGYIAQGLENPPTFDRAEIIERVAYCRAKNGVSERPQSETKLYVHKGGNGWVVKPPRRMVPAGVKQQKIYNNATRALFFEEKNEAVAAYEKFAAQSTSDDERKAMMRPPRDAYICAHCGKGFFTGKDPGRRLLARQLHERSCQEQSYEDESEEEESDEDESEEEEPEEAVEPPPPKRARLCEFLSSWGF